MKEKIISSFDVSETARCKICSTLLYEERAGIYMLGGDIVCSKKCLKKYKKDKQS